MLIIIAGKEKKILFKKRKITFVNKLKLEPIFQSWTIFSTVSYQAFFVKLRWRTSQEQLDEFDRKSNMIFDEKQMAIWYKLVQLEIRPVLLDLIVEKDLNNKWFSEYKLKPIFVTIAIFHVPQSAKEDWSDSLVTIFRVIWSRPQKNV